MNIKNNIVSYLGVSLLFLFFLPNVRSQNLESKVLWGSMKTGSLINFRSSVSEIENIDTHQDTYKYTYSVENKGPKNVFVCWEALNRAFSGRRSGPSIIYLQVNQTKTITIESQSMPVSKMGPAVIWEEADESFYDFLKKDYGVTVDTHGDFLNYSMSSMSFFTPEDRVNDTK